MYLETAKDIIILILSSGLIVALVIIAYKQEFGGKCAPPELQDCDCEQEISDLKEKLDAAETLNADLTCKPDFPRGSKVRIKGYPEIYIAGKRHKSFVACAVPRKFTDESTLNLIDELGVRVVDIPWMALELVDEVKNAKKRVSGR